MTAIITNHNIPIFSKTIHVYLLYKTASAVHLFTVLYYHQLLYRYHLLYTPISPPPYHHHTTTLLPPYYQPTTNLPPPYHHPTTTLPPPHYPSSPKVWESASKLPGSDEDHFNVSRNRLKPIKSLLWPMLFLPIAVITNPPLIDS